MPAAAVIPAPIAYIKVVAVKKLVVGFLIFRFAYLGHQVWLLGFKASVILAYLNLICAFLTVCFRVKWASFTVKKLECSKQVYFNLEYISME